MSPKIPKFKTEDEEVEFWDTHDTTDFLEELEAETELVFVRAQKEVVSLRMDRQMVQAIRKVAHRKGIGYTPLIRMWLLERLQEELANKPALSRKKGRKAA